MLRCCHTHGGTTDEHHGRHTSAAIFCGLDDRVSPPVGCYTRWEMLSFAKATLPPRICRLFTAPDISTSRFQAVPAKL